MRFQENAKPIYLQIADRICDDVSSGKYAPESRLPSVREYASLLKVNVNTVMRSFEHLATGQIIYNKRGLGYFVSPDASIHIEEMRRSTFFDEECSYFFERLKSIGIKPEQLTQLYINYTNTHK